MTARHFCKQEVLRWCANIPPLEIEIWFLTLTNKILRYAKRSICVLPLLTFIVSLYLKILFRAFNFIIKSIIRNLIIFKKPRKMTNGFFNNHIFVHTFQWTSSQCLINVTITVKVAMVTYIHCENLTSEAYLL